VIVIHCKTGSLWGATADSTSAALSKKQRVVLIPRHLDAVPLPVCFLDAVSLLLEMSFTIAPLP